jgi:hypothetical protein
MTFNVQIINNAVPALSVQADESGGVTYDQIKQSLGSQVYEINKLYLYSDNVNQLLGVVQYQRFDSGGTQNYSSIALTVDPYNGNGNAIDVDLTKFSENFILNGNSSLAATVLPNTFLQIKFYANRITNSFGDNLSNFKQIEIDANKPNFYDNLGSEIDEIKKTNKKIEESATSYKSFDAKSNTIKRLSGEIKSKNNNNYIIFGILALGIIIYSIKKLNKKVI